jgi:hypothetical protein
VARNHLVNEEKKNKNRHQLKVVIGQKGILGPEKSQDHGRDQKKAMEQEFSH